MRKVIIGAVILTLLVIAGVVSVTRGGNRGVEVRLEAVAERDLVATVTASGKIRARRTVDISADVSGRVVELNVDEGDEVAQGAVLLRIDPTQYRAAVQRNEAALAQARARSAQEEANLLRTRREGERVNALFAQDAGLVSRQQVEEAETSLQVAEANLSAAGFGVDQAAASLEEARDGLARTTIRAPIAGTVTRLNIELGETAVVGTMNNPGSLLLTISDLAEVEAVLRVDETDVPRISLGDSAVVEIDAFPDQEFAGRVTRIGSSAVTQATPTAAGTQSSVDFEVLVRLETPPVELRPDLSATADIVTATRSSVPAIPIIALTIRDSSPLGEEDPGAPARGGRTQPSQEEGVFVVREGKVSFQPVTVGVGGQDYFEILQGVQLGDTVVSGPYQRIRELRDGDAVRPATRPGGPTS